MKELLSTKSAIIVLLLAFLCVIFWVAIPEEIIDYNSQVKPILNKHCISCHGGVKQSGGFSLLFENEAKGKTESGLPAIIPGHPDQSEMIRRLTSDDPEERMPYEKEPLSKSEIRILKKWIEQGAVWDTHWAYVPVKEVKVMQEFAKDGQFTSWAKNDIDYFIYEKLKELKLNPSFEAEPAILARRLSFDLLGLPDYQGLSDDFLQNPSKENLNKYIDELLNSPHFSPK